MKRKLTMRYLLVSLLMLLTGTALAQMRIEGKVLDAEDRLPLAGASVRLMKEVEDDPDGELIAYAIADDKGYYRLSVESRPQVEGKYRLEYRCLGYVPYRSAVRWESGQSRMLRPDVLLSPSDTKLREVTVQSTPVYTRGDTIKYMAHAYSDAGTRTLADLIARIPGLEVETDGIVRYQGKPISELYIEGLSSVGDNYGLVVNNLDIQAVSGVEVLQRHQRVRALKDVEVPDAAALNILLKDKNKLRPTGQWDVGGGYESDLSYDTNLYAMLIGRRSQTLLSVMADNCGHLREEGGFILAQGAQMPEAGNLIGVTEGRYGPPLSQKYYMQGNDLSTGLMHGRRIGPYGMLRLGGGYTYQTTSQEGWMENVYMGGDGAVTISEHALSSQERHNVKAELHYQHNADSLFVENNFSFLGSHHDTRNNLFADAHSLYAVKRQFGSFDNFFHYIKKTKSGKVRRFMTNLFGRSLPTAHISVLKDEGGIAQLIDGYDFGGQVSGGYSARISKQLSVSAATGLAAVYRGYGLSDIEEAPQTMRHYSGYDLNVSLAPGFTFEEGALRIEGQLPLTYYGRGFRDKVAVDYLVNKVLPEWNLLLRYDMNGYFRFDWTLAYTDKMDVPATLITQPIITEYNQIVTHTAGAVARNRTYVSRFGLQYSDVMSGVMASATIAVVKDKGNLIRDFDVSQGQITYTTQSYRSSGLSWNSSSFLSWRIRPLKTKLDLSGRYAYSQTEAMRAGVIYPVVSHRFSLRPSLLFTPIRSLSWEASVSWGYTRLFHQYEEVSYRSQRHEMRASSRLTWQLLPQWDFFTSADYIRLELQPSGSRHIYFADAGTRYRLGRYELSATVDNLFNTKSYETGYQIGMDSFHAFYHLRPRRYLLTFRISF